MEPMYHCKNNMHIVLYVSLSKKIFIKNYWKKLLPGSKFLGEMPCLTITKVSNPKPIAIQILLYLFAKTVGSHLDSL